jgi:hypothetical protein
LGYLRVLVLTTMSRHDTAVYIGAGLDFIPVFKFRHITTFIYADCMPKYSGNIEHEELLERPKFPLELYQTMKRLGFQKVLSDEHGLSIYVNRTRGTTIKYYMNIRFPLDKENGSFLYEVKNASVLICCGHATHRSIVDYMKPGKKLFIGNNRTIYKSSPEDGEVGIDLAIEERSDLFEKYYKIHIPIDYRYWDHENVDSSEFIRFHISEHSSLKDLRKRV